MCTHTTAYTHADLIGLSHKYGNHDAECFIFSRDSKGICIRIESIAVVASLVLL